MTWTVLTYDIGNNETEDIAPGRGGYSTVLVNESPEDAVVWWEDLFGKDPTRLCTYPETMGRNVWNVEEAHTLEQALDHCGEKTLDKGGIGVPMTRRYTLDELRGRLDVWVVASQEDVPDAL